MKPSKGFTLIELLIVVAIIAIISTIALVNYLYAQTRAKISKIAGEEYTLALALESYYTDNNDYPPDSFHGSGFWQTIYPWIPVTTPVSYITSALHDPYYSPQSDPQIIGYYTYVHEPLGREFGPEQGNIRFRWCVYSYGPARNNGITDSDKLDHSPVTARYDPTNGTTSYGQVGRFGP